jgi:hypothetical protein
VGDSSLPLGAVNCQVEITRKNNSLSALFCTERKREPEMSPYEEDGVGKVEVEVDALTR